MEQFPAQYVAECVWSSSNLALLVITSMFIITLGPFARDESYHNPVAQWSDRTAKNHNETTVIEVEQNPTTAATIPVPVASRPQIHGCLNNGRGGVSCD